MNGGGHLYRCFNWVVVKEKERKFKRLTVHASVRSPSREGRPLLLECVRGPSS